MQIHAQYILHLFDRSWYVICSGLDLHLICQDNWHCDHNATIWKYNEFLNEMLVWFFRFVSICQILCFVRFFFSLPWKQRSLIKWPKILRNNVKGLVKHMRTVAISPQIRGYSKFSWVGLSQKFPTCAYLHKPKTS